MKKGFTLVELLAVIIILGIIVLIAIPVIDNVISNSRVESEKQSVVAFSRAVQSAVDNYMLIEGKEPEVNVTWAINNATTSGNDVACEDVRYDYNGVILENCKVEDSDDVYCVVNTDIVECDALPEDYYYTCRNWDEWKHEATPASDFVFDESAGRILEYTNETNKDVVIPCEINGVEVKEIGYYYDHYVEGGSTIYLDNSEENYNSFLDYVYANDFDYAFRSMSLSSVILNDNIESIGGEVFRENKLSSIYIPGSVKKIGTKAFERNELTTITLNYGLENVGSYAFRWHDSQAITIPSSVIRIGTTALDPSWDSGMPALSNIIIINLNGKCIENQPFSQSYFYGKYDWIGSESGEFQVASIIIKSDSDLNCEIKEDSFMTHGFSF